MVSLTCSLVLGGWLYVPGFKTHKLTWLFTISQGDIMGLSKEVWLTNGNSSGENGSYVMGSPILRPLYPQIGYSKIYPQWSIFFFLEVPSCAVKGLASLPEVSWPFASQIGAFHFFWARECFEQTHFVRSVWLPKHRHLEVSYVMGVPPVIIHF